MAAALQRYHQEVSHRGHPEEVTPTQRKGLRLLECKDGTIVRSVSTEAVRGTPSPAGPPPTPVTSPRGAVTDLVGLQYPGDQNSFGQAHETDADAEAVSKIQTMEQQHMRMLAVADKKAVATKGQTAQTNGSASASCCDGADASAGVGSKCAPKAKSGPRGASGKPKTATPKVAGGKPKTAAPKVAVAKRPAVQGGDAPTKKKGIPPCPARQGTTFYLTGKIMGSVSKGGWPVFPDVSSVNEKLVKYNDDHKAAWVTACGIIRAHGR